MNLPPAVYDERSEVALTLERGRREALDFSRILDELGAWLRARREELGLTQRALAERADVSHVMIHFVEWVARRPAVPTLDRILQALECSEEDRQAIQFLRDTIWPTARKVEKAPPAEES